MSAVRPRTSANFAGDLQAARVERLNGHPTGDTFPLLTGDDLLRQPDPSWLIDGIVPASGLSVIYGPSGAGKSFLALDWALCTAAGLPWLGREVEQRRVVYIAAEGRAGFGVRYRAWLAARGLQNVERIGFLLDAVDLRDRQQVDRARRTLASLPERPGLLVVDTMARAMVGGDENAAKDVGEFIAAVDGLREADAAVVVHHTGKDRASERGSSALRAAADLMAKLERDGHAGRLALSCDKAKDAAEWEQIPLQLDPAGGSCVLSLVVEKQEARDDLRDRVLAYVVANGPVGKKQIRADVTGGNPAIDAALLSLHNAHLISRSRNGYERCPDALGTPGHLESGASGEEGCPAGGIGPKGPPVEAPSEPVPTEACPDGQGTPEDGGLFEPNGGQLCDTCGAHLRAFGSRLSCPDCEGPNT
jgi:hypothetical protein